MPLRWCECVCVTYGSQICLKWKSTSCQSQWMWLIFFSLICGFAMQMDIWSSFVNVCEISCQCDRTINNRHSWTNNFYYLISHPQMSYNTESTLGRVRAPVRSLPFYTNRWSANRFWVRFDLVLISFAFATKCRQMRKNLSHKNTYTERERLWCSRYVSCVSLAVWHNGEIVRHSYAYTIDYEQWFLNCTIAEQWAFYCAVNIERIFLYTTTSGHFRNVT